MRKLPFVTLTFTLLGAAAAIFAMAPAAPAESVSDVETDTGASNKVVIRQTGSGNTVRVRQTSPTADGVSSVLSQQDVTDSNNNHAVIVQQGPSNIADYTQQGRFNNVVNSGTVFPAPSAGDTPSATGQVTVEQFGPADAHTTQ